MIPKQLKGFISALSDFTEEEKIVWIEGDNDAFFCDHKNHTLHIWHRFDEDRGQQSFIFRLVTAGKPTQFTVTEDERDYDIMRCLYESVIANANNVSEDIADFFE